MATCMELLLLESKSEEEKRLMLMNLIGRKKKEYNKWIFKKTTEITENLNYPMKF